MLIEVIHSVWESNRNKARWYDCPVYTIESREIYSLLLNNQYYFERIDIFYITWVEKQSKHLALFRLISQINMDVVWVDWSHQLSLRKQSKQGKVIWLPCLHKRVKTNLQFSAWQSILFWENWYILYHMSIDTIKASYLVSIDLSDKYGYCVCWLKLSTQSEKAIETRQGDMIALFTQSSQDKYTVFCLTINIFFWELIYFISHE